MKAAVYYETGAPEVLKYEEVADPVCHPRGILLAVEAVSIEGGDVLNRAGGNLTHVPHVVGYQAAGTIIEVGAEVRDRKVGQRVVTSGADGSHGAIRAVAARGSWLLPDSLSVEVGAYIPIPFGTADDCLFEFGRLQAGETVLVQGGAGGVGLAAIQLAKRAGAKVISTASSQEKLDFLLTLGVDHVVNYVASNLLDEVRRITDNKGVNLVVDPIGGEVLQNSIRALGYRGRVTTVGNAGREVMKFDLNGLMGMNQYVHGVFLGAEIATDRVYNKIQAHIEAVAKGELKVFIDKQFALFEAAAAHAYIESRQAIGRVLLIP